MCYRLACIKVPFLKVKRILSLLFLFTPRAPANSFRHVTLRLLIGFSICFASFVGQHDISVHNCLFSLLFYFVVIYVKGE